MKTRKTLINLVSALAILGSSQLTLANEAAPSPSTRIVDTEILNIEQPLTFPWGYATVEYMLPCNGQLMDVLQHENNSGNDTFIDIKVLVEVDDSQPCLMHEAHESPAKTAIPVLTESGNVTVRPYFGRDLEKPQVISFTLLEMFPSSIATFELIVPCEYQNQIQVETFEYNGSLMLEAVYTTNKTLPSGYFCSAGEMIKTTISALIPTETPVQINAIY